MTYVVGNWFESNYSRPNSGFLFSPPSNTYVHLLKVSSAPRWVHAMNGHKAFRVKPVPGEGFTLSLVLARRVQSDGC